MNRPLRLLSVLTLLLATAACREKGPTPAPGSGKATLPPDKRPDILLVTVDGLRADGFRAAGAGAATRALDGLANGGIFFRSAYTLSPLPLAASGTILTGLPPAVHGAAGPGGTLDPSLPTLATLLSAAGWRSEAIVSSRRLAKETGLGRGFAGYDDGISAAEPVRSAVDAFERAKARIAVSPDRPLFLWVALSPSLPDDRGGSLDERGRHYLSVVSGVDQALEEFLPAFASRSRSPKAILITGTHGWELGEHPGAFGAGRTLFEGALRVPILASLPGWAQLQPPSTATHLDIAPTILGLAGIAPPEGLTGRRLEELALEPVALERPIAFESRLPELAGEGAALLGIRLGDWKLIEEGSSAWLFDLGRDPREAADARGWRPTEVVRLREEREKFLASVRKGRAPRSAPPLPPRELLRSLGY